MASKHYDEGSVFNRVRMGYAVIASRKADAWRRLLGEAIGMQTDALSSESVRARMDDRECRLLVVPGRSEDLQALGLELDDEQTLNIVLARLGSHGIQVKEGTAEAARLRGVTRFWHFTGPKELELELFYQPRLVSSPPTMLASGFITGNKGFGHVAITTLRPEAMKQFWCTIFDSRHTDDVHYTISGIPLRFEFFRFNERHHSVALAYTPKVKLDPIRTRIQHVEVQIATLDDLGAAYRRCRKAGLPVTMNVGQHANDKAVSFYVRTPSGFDLECGWNPVSINEENWKGELWDRISEWGHRPAHQMPNRIMELGRSLTSLARTEFMPAGF